MHQKIKTIFLVVFLFILMNSIVYFITKINQEDRVKTTLETHIDKLKTHYDIVLQHQKVIADAVYKTTVMQDGVVDIFSKASKTSDKKELTKLREELFNKLKIKYDIMKTKGILQYHFVFPNNVVFLRMHKPSKYDDDLSNIRLDFKNTNDIKKINRGLSPGKTTHAFRNIYPIYDKNENYIGALDIAFPSEVLQDSLTSISKIHTHFIINKHVFDFKSWYRDDMILKYQPSAENDEYFLTMTNQHTKNFCIDQLSKKIKSQKESIKKLMYKHETFALYYIDEDDVATVMSFLPIKDNITHKTIAWLVTYENDEFITRTIDTSFYIRLISFFIFLILCYFMYKILNQKEILNIQVNKKTKELKEFNLNLEQKVKDEVEKNMQTEVKYSTEIEKHLNKERYLRSIMATIADINRYLITEKALDKLLTIIVKRFIKQNYYEFCYIGLLEDKKLVKHYMSKEDEFTNKFIQIIKNLSEDKFSDCPIQNSIDKNHEVIINNINSYDMNKFYSESFKQAGFTSLVSFPIKKDASSDAVGVIVMFSSRDEGFYVEEISMLEELSGDIGFAINSFKQQEEIDNLHNKMIKNYEEGIFGFVNMIEQRDPYTAGHTTRVAEYSKMIAQKMGYEKKDIDNLYKASILHDIGKVSTPDSVLLKPSRLNSLEYQLIQEHVTVGYEMLKNIELYKDLAEIMHYHHERYDGNGYPLGLKGDEIPELSAIMSIADSFDAMTSTRIYKKGKSVEEALKEIESLKGIQFNPKIVDVALEVLKGIENDTNINQNPTTAIEIERLAYFYKDYLSGLYNENYLALLLNQKDFKLKYNYYYQVNIKDYVNYSVFKKAFEILSIELSENLHKLLSFKYKDNNILIISNDENEINNSIDRVKDRCKSLHYQINIDVSKIDINMLEL
jgi:putative nucleotidyltransferase with HDIG domain